ncbi:MAG: hypothetical protein ABIM30_00535 [candidate division WOR-3 bacterium]
MKANVVSIESTYGGFIVYDSDGNKYVIGSDGSNKSDAEALVRALTITIDLLGYGGRFNSDSSETRIVIEAK